MKTLPALLFSASFLVLAGCSPNLVVKDAAIDFNAQVVRVAVANVGDRDAKQHLTYIEINEVGAADAAKPQSQYSASVSGIAAGGTWDPGPIAFASFSSPRGLDLSTLTSANLVVRADAKNLVKESNENDNLYDRDH